MLIYIAIQNVNIKLYCLAQIKCNFIFFFLVFVLTNVTLTGICNFHAKHPGCARLYILYLHFIYL